MLGTGFILYVHLLNFYPILFKLVEVCSWMVETCPVLAALFLNFILYNLPPDDWLIYWPSCGMVLNVDIGSIWSSFRTYSRNIGILWVYVQGYSRRALSYHKKRICCMGWFWSRILYQPRRSRRMEKCIHCVWLCSIWRYGNFRENCSASN